MPSWPTQLAASSVLRSVCYEGRRAEPELTAVDLYGPSCDQVFQAKAAPRYISAWIAHIVIYGVYILLAILLRIILMRRNVLKRRAATGSDDGVRTAFLRVALNPPTLSSDPRSFFSS